MTLERVIEVLECEKQCVIRNIEKQCNRDCAKCDLLQPDMDIVIAYKYALSVLNNMR